jgi:hypothetical protein
MSAACAFVALHAVFKIGDAFANMLCPNGIWLMFMASEAGVAAGVVVHMAGGTRGCVRAFKQEEFRVVEIGRLPGLLAMALPAIGTGAAMRRCVGRYVARGTLCAGRGQQQRV